jgi:hypothetical protein
MKVPCLAFLLLVASAGAVAPARSPGLSPQAGPAAATAIPAAELADIRAYMAASGTAARVRQAMRTGIDAVAPFMQRELPPGAYQKRLLALFTQTIIRRAQPVMTRIIVAVIAQHFSDSEIRRLTAFYRTPLGRKVVALRPAMASEMIAQVQTIAARLGRQSMLDVLKDHPHLAKQLKQAAWAARQAAAH